MNMLRRSRRETFGIIAWVIALTVPLSAQPAISLVSDDEPGAAVRFGLNELRAALTSRRASFSESTDLASASGSSLVVAGLAAGQGAAAQLLETAGEEPPTGPEALAIFETRFNGARTLVLIGADDRGLMYALQDTANRIRWAAPGEDPLTFIAPIREQPDVTERSLCKMVVHPDEFESYCFDEAYWDRYLGMLARYRYNTFHLLFGYESRGYFEPFFPYILEVEEYPEIRVEGVSGEKRQKYLEMLQMVGRKTRQYGLDFTVGIWTHIYRAREHGPGVTHGLTDENLVDYNVAALSKFLEVMPDLDTIQFRVHVESSLRLPQQKDFWTRMLDTIRESGHSVRVDMRAKGFTDDLIEASLATRVPFRMATKYWGEKLGMAHHPTHLEILNQFKRRHGYANLLRYPKSYDMLWRLWSHGTVRLLHWFNPQYVRDFVAGTHLYDGAGYDVHEPLPNKLWHNEIDDPVDRYDVFKEPYRFYDWEFERYWPYYLVFGRVGYNPNTPSEVWLKEFETRFGDEPGGLLADALATASDILPRILGYSMPNLNASSNLPETSRNYDLPRYAGARNLPGDDALFVPLLEASRLDLAGMSTVRVHPRQTSQWFDQTCDAVDRQVDLAEKKSADKRSPEFHSMVADLRILSSLGRYHARRIEAGLNYNYFRAIGDLHALDEAIRLEQEAINHWERIVSAATEVYADELIFEADHHWRNELKPLRSGVEDLRRERAQYEVPKREAILRFDFGEGGAAPGWLPVGYETEYDLAAGGWGWLPGNRHFLPPPELSTGHDSNLLGDFVRGPREYNFSTFVCDLPPGSYRLVFTMQDTSPEPEEYGPMWFVVNGVDETEHFNIPAGEEIRVPIDSHLDDENLSVVVKAESDARWLINSLEIIPVSPSIAHVPIQRVTPGVESEVWVTVHGVAPAERVTMRVGNEARGFSSSDLKKVRENLYTGRLPSAVDGEILEYSLDALDQEGHLGHWPDASEVRQKVFVTRDTAPPEVAHAPETSAPANTPLRIVARAKDESGVAWLRLRYRSVNQHQDFLTLPMLPTGESGEFAATIPAHQIRSRWDLMYFIEAMDHKGNGGIVPGLGAPMPYVVVELNR